MKIATINLPDNYLQCVDILVNLGFFPSRSECLREAIKTFISKDLSLNNKIRPKAFEELKAAQMSKMMH